MTDFDKYAVAMGVNSNTLDSYKKKFGIISPTIIEERPLNVATMDVFSKLIGERIIFLGTGIDSDVANIVNAQLMYLNSIDSESDIKLWVNSPGGVCDDGLAIYDIMNWVDCDVSTYVMGMAASMGSIILSSGAKGKRFALPHSKVMIHQVSGGGHGQCADVQIVAAEMKKTQDELYTILAENTGKTFEQIEADADRDHWLTAKEALEYGLIDEIITKKK